MRGARPSISTKGQRGSDRTPEGEVPQKHAYTARPISSFACQPAVLS